IERHHANPIALEDLAGQAGLSSSHLHAQFRKHVGMTPHQHLILERMRRAKHLLVSTNQPVKAVASSVGYANTENFCRAFRKNFGTTAALYRRKFKTY
ncbi:MAG: helix-turn-helix transcriptional regulator, partial [Terrimicrobiaceae bacterium]